MDREVFEEIKAEFNQALPGLIRGEPDRTDLMIPLCRAIDWKDPDREIGPGEVKAAVLEIYGITKGELYANMRHDPVVTEAKQMAAYVMVKHCSLTMNRAARSMRRDHSTISHSVRKIEGRLQEPGVVRHMHRVLKFIGIHEQ